MRCRRANLVVRIVEKQRKAGVEMLSDLLPPHQLQLPNPKQTASAKADPSELEKEGGRTMTFIFSLVSSDLNRNLPQFSNSSAAHSMLDPERSSMSTL